MERVLILQNMNCENPIRIFNNSLKRYMYVPCRQCRACRITSANKKAVDLANTLKQYPYIYFVTLTYSNKYLPVVLVDDNRIIRGCEEPFGEILDYLDLSPDKECKVPQNSNIECTGVLYYPDLQNFIKRLRVYYERKYKQSFPYRYAAAGDLASKNERPHFHVVFYGRKEGYEQLLSAVIKNWSFADWSKLDLSECFKIGDHKSAFYLASYINSAFSNSRFHEQKRIKQKVLRSKDPSFGAEAKIYDTLKQIVKRGFVSREICDSMEPPFTYIDTSQIDDVSPRIIPARFFRSYFSKPRFCSTSSYNDFCRCCGEVFVNYDYDRQYVKSSDYLFILGYKHYLSLTGYIDNFHIRNIYLLSFWNLYNFYKSQQLKFQMMGYESMPEYDYYVDLTDTYIDNVNKRFRQLRKYDKAKKLFEKIYHPVSDTTQRIITNYIDKHKTKLLKKHCHNEINF